jgi:hypothetical protein
MSNLRVVPLLFRESPEGLTPADATLYSRVMQYCQANLAEIPDLKRYARTYAVIEEGSNGEIIEVHHVSFFRYAPDIAGFRSTGPRAKQATKLAYERWQSYFADNGWAGQDVMIWIDGDENLEQQCANREGSIREFDLRPAKRMLVKVR